MRGEVTGEPASGLNGIIAPLATATNMKGRYQDQVMANFVSRLKEDVEGLFVRGTSGEYAALTDGDAEHVLATVVEAVGGSVAVIVGIGDTSTPRTMERLHVAGGSGADFAAVTTTYYYPASDSELERYFTEIAEHSPIPILLYQIPQNTHVTLTIEAIARLAEHPNIVGIKDSSGDFLAFQELLAHRSANFAVLQGREQLAAASLLAGADGVISALANIAPALLGRLLDACRGGAVEEANVLQREVNDVARIFGEDNWLAALKAALEEIGFPVGPPIPPAREASPEARERIRRRLRATGIISPAGAAS